MLLEVATVHVCFIQVCVCFVVFVSCLFLFVCACVRIPLCFASESVWCFFYVGVVFMCSSWFVLWFVLWFVMCNVRDCVCVSVVCHVCVFLDVQGCVSVFMYHGCVSVCLCACSRAVFCVFMLKGVRVVS